MKVVRTDCTLSRKPWEIAGPPLSGSHGWKTDSSPVQVRACSKESVVEEGF